MPTAQCTAATLMVGSGTEKAAYRLLTVVIMMAIGYVAKSMEQVLNRLLVNTMMVSGAKTRGAEEGESHSQTEQFKMVFGTTG